VHRNLSSRQNKDLKHDEQLNLNVKVNWVKVGL